jgi:hypothetical protein
MLSALSPCRHRRRCRHPGARRRARRRPCSLVCRLPARAAAAQAARRINLSFSNTDAADVLRAISLQSGVNIAPLPSLRGRRITVRLRGVSVEEALRAVAAAADARYQRVDSTYVIGSAEEVRRAAAAGAAASVVTAALRNLTPAARERSSRARCRRFRPGGRGHAGGDPERVGGGRCPRPAPFGRC